MDPNDGPLRGLLALDLAANRSRQQQLIEFLATVNDAIDRVRVRRGLQRELRQNGNFGPILKGLQRWKLDATLAHHYVRRQQYKELMILIMRYIDLATRHPLPAEQTTMIRNAIKTLILRHLPLLKRCLEEDMRKGDIIPEDFEDLLYWVLEIPIGQEPVAPLIVVDNHNNQAQVNPSNSESLSEDDQHDDQNQQPAIIEPMRFRQVQLANQLVDHYDNMYQFVDDMLPREMQQQIRQNPAQYVAMNTLFMRSIEADPLYWQVERSLRDDVSVFFHEVVFRLLNSIRHIQLHEGEANAPANNYYLTVETDLDSRSYRIYPERLLGLLEALEKQIDNDGAVAQVRQLSSDIEENVAQGVAIAKRVRLGPIESIFQVFAGNRIFPPNLQLVHQSIPHPLYNLTHRQNPYGTARDVLALRNDHEIDQFTARLRALPRQSLLVARGWDIHPKQVTNFPARYSWVLNKKKRKRAKKQKRKNNPRQGNFFPFFNLTQYDLHRYQIVATPQELENAAFDDCCLVYALRMSGLLSMTELTEMDCNIITRQVKPAKMANFFTAHDIKLRVKTIRDQWLDARIAGRPEECCKTRFTVAEFGEGTRVITVFLLCGHFMLDEETPIKRYAFDHREEIFKNYYSLENTIRSKRAPNGTVYSNNDLITKIGSNGYPRRDSSRKGMLSSELITELFIQYKQGKEKIFKPMLFDDVSCLNSPVFKDTHKRRRNIDILERLLKEPIEKIQAEEYKTLQYSNDSVKPLVDPSQRLIRNGKQKVRYDRLQKLRIFYADFESCTADNNGVYLEAHIPFMCCIRESRAEGHDEKATFTGTECGKEILDWVLDHCTDEGTLPIVYFHNLSYDINFLMKYGIISAVNRNSLILQADFCYKGRQIRLKDSYGLLSMPLRSMARSFKIEIEKEIFPYTYYSPERVNANIGDVDGVFELEQGWSEEDKAQFINNLRQMDEDNIHAFDMIKYAKFYCERDVDVLQRCIDLFHEQIQTSFDIDCHRVISISSIADQYLRKTVYYPFGQMYMYSNHIRDFLLDAVHGGRVMCARNERHHFVASDAAHGLWDLDAVSLYPSAMSCLYTVGGRPTPLDLWELNYDYLEQSQDITAYVVEIYITGIPKARDFPLVIEKDPRTGKITYTNTPPVRMTVCDIELQDLVEFQHIEFHILRGLKWTGPRDYTLQTVVRDLFEKRAAYKKAKNPLENSYKLLLNSIYGKTIQKAIDHEYKYYKLSEQSEQEQFQTWLVNHSNYIEKVTQLKDSDILRIKQIMPIHKHFNNTLLGVQILAMSKHLMNRVMCLADDLHLDVYYQDTDSMHIRRDHVPLLERAFAERYHSALRGSALCQFHPDFDPICSESVPEEVVATESYFLGKKCYIDRLTDQLGNIGYHIRMKGVSQKSIEHAAQGDLLGLYKKLFDGETITFDLCCDGQVKFDNAKDGTVRTRDHFERAVQATAAPEQIDFNERWEIDNLVEILLNQSESLC